MKKMYIVSLVILILSGWLGYKIISTLDELFNEYHTHIEEVSH